MAKERFDKIIENLEKIVEQLEAGELSLEDSLGVFKDGVDLVKKGTARLNEMEEKVELLLKEVESEETVPFEPDGMTDEDSEEDGEL